MGLIGKEDEIKLDGMTSIYFYQLVDQAFLKGPDYFLMPIDLRELDTLKAALQECKIDFNAPTLVFAECVLIYISSNESNAVLKFFNDNFATIYIMNWEMMKLNDQFGKIMIKNFEVIE